MIGNDIVDLRDPDTRAGALHPRFDRRVFTAAERAALGASANPTHLRWSLWAAKESAYKAARAQDAAVVFSPPRFSVQLVTPRRAVVQHAHRAFRVCIDVSCERIHAIAWAGSTGTNLLVSKVSTDTAMDPSATARRLAVSTLAPYLNASVREVTIVRRQRTPPYLLLRGRPVAAHLTLSHHGRFVAFACALPADGGDGSVNMPRSCSSQR